MIKAGKESPPELDHHQFGLWDTIYNSGIVTELNSAKRWAPVDKQLLDKVTKQGFIAQPGVEEAWPPKGRLQVQQTHRGAAFGP